MGRAFEYRRASKEKRWDKMSKLFPKLARTITLAAKEGGSDPESNPKLRSAIQHAKVQNMPKDNIEKALARAAGNDGAAFQEVNYEGKAAHGVQIWVECATDNNTRTVANVKMHFKKEGAELLNSGALEFLFSRKAVAEFEVKEGMNIEEVELGLIDAGLQELEVEDGQAIAYADFKDFGALAKGFQDLGIDDVKLTVKRISSNPIELSEEQLEEIEPLIDRLEDDDDVQAVFTNIA
jgi:YebC/PmpR family DNA-binding regulatory protein